MEERLQGIVRESDLYSYIEILAKVIPEAWLAGGAVRNTVWKKLFPNSNLVVRDLDVFYCLPNLPREKDLNFEKELEQLLPTEKWECCNQAYVHLYEPREEYWHPNAPYRSMEESMKDWSFTANAVGIRLYNDQIEILALYGLEDLFNGVIRLTEAAKGDPRPFLSEYIGGIMQKCSDLSKV